MGHQLIGVTFTQKQQPTLAANPNFVPDTDGTHLHIEGGVAMNDNTGNSGVASIYNQVSIQAVSLTATNSNVTATDASTLYISGQQVVTETLTNSYALFRGRYQSSW